MYLVGRNHDVIYAKTKFLICNGDLELSDRLCDSLNKSLTLVRLSEGLQNVRLSKPFCGASGLFTALPPFRGASVLFAALPAFDREGIWVATGPGGFYWSHAETQLCRNLRQGRC